jgi:hypothetical protein
VGPDDGSSESPGSIGRSEDELLVTAYPEAPNVGDVDYESYDANPQLHATASGKLPLELETFDS